MIYEENIRTEKETDHIDEESDNSFETEEDSGTESCNYCGEVFDDIDDLIDHFGTTGHNLKDDKWWIISENDIYIYIHANN